MASNGMLRLIAQGGLQWSMQKKPANKFYWIFHGVWLRSFAFQNTSLFLLQHVISGSGALWILHEISKYLARLDKTVTQAAVFYCIYVVAENPGASTKTLNFFSWKRSVAILCKASCCSCFIFFAVTCLLHVVNAARSSAQDLENLCLLRGGSRQTLELLLLQWLEQIERKALI